MLCSDLIFMRVAVYYNNNDVRIEERPIPVISPDEILVKAIACGICGSDVLEWYRIKSAPRILGHEMTGTIVQSGKNVPKLQVGDRVFVSHHVPCNACYYCRNGHHTACETLHTTNFDPGGFSEYIRIPQINIKHGTLLLPSTISYEEGTLIEPLGCVVRGQRLIHITPGQTVLILGCGVTGLLHIQLAKHAGAKRVIATDIQDYRLAAAKQFGADVTIRAHEDVPAITRAVNDHRLADKIIVCTGALPAVYQAYHSIDRGGTILFFAVPPPNETVTIPLPTLWRHEITLMTTYGASPSDLIEASTLIRNHHIKAKEMITHRFSLDDISSAFRLVAEAKESMKVIVKM
jgi:L-iditol 2-dehydrogenase